MSVGPPSGAGPSGPNPNSINRVNPVTPSHQGRPLGQQDSDRTRAQGEDARKKALKKGTGEAGQDEHPEKSSEQTPVGLIFLGIMILAFILHSLFGGRR